MVGFTRTPEGLSCDGVLLSAIAESESTPLYVYSAAVVRDRYRALDAAFGSHPHRLHYALKANSSLALAHLMAGLGSAADANSLWEIELARKAGFEVGDIVFTGVGKSPAELERAVPMGLKAINVESAGELARVEAIARCLGIRARVALRLNPDIDANSHPHISTGLRINKFGIPRDLAHEVIQSLTHRPSLALVAIHVHVGSQITTVDPLARAAAFIADVVADVTRQGLALEYVDLGGGLGISYDGQDVPSAERYATALIDAVRHTNLPIVIEPGRSIVGPAGALLARVIDIKPRTADSHFAVLDAGMTELMRPALYGAYHRVEAVRPRSGEERQYEFVGPVCESSDVIGRDRVMTPIEVGDLMLIRDAGAYGAAMASNYNRRPMPAEVLVDDGSWRVIRRRQTLDDMTSLETR